MQSNNSLRLLAILALVVAVANASILSLPKVNFWVDDAADNIALMEAGKYNPYREFNEMVNSLFFNMFHCNSIADYVSSNFDEHTSYYLRSYLRDLIMGTMVYWLTAGLWHLTIYKIKGDHFFTQQNRKFPETSTIIDQICMAQTSLFMYATLPIVSSFLIENGYTRVYFYLDQIGGVWNYLFYLVAYIFFVDIGVYWVHRILHENKFLYKYVHSLHHKYNTAATMTPWCSLAFNPIDGLLQASPYVVFLFIIPVHFLTHIFLLFFTGVWATNIHDSMWFDTEPIMGSKYHTLHHTHYHYNFGQFFTFSDYIFGTLRPPKKGDFKEE